MTTAGGTTTGDASTEIASTPGALNARPGRRGGSASTPQRTPAHISQHRDAGLPHPPPQDAVRLVRGDRPGADALGAETGRDDEPFPPALVDEIIDEGPPVRVDSSHGQ